MGSTPLTVPREGRCGVTAHHTWLNLGRAWLAGVSLFLAAHPNSVQAASGTSVSSVGHGLSLTVSTQWLDGGGYRPVHVAIVPAAPPLADQTLHIEFHAQQYYFGSRETAVSQDIEIPAGSTRVDETIAVPQHFSFQACKIEVWINGRYSTKLSLRSFAAATGAQMEGLPNVLVVAGAAAPAVPSTPTTPIALLAADPDSSLLASIFPPDVSQQQYYGALAATTAAGVAAPLPTLITLPYTNLPRRWIELSSLDLICISLADFTSLAAGEPERCQALRQWTAAGGNLIVFDLGAQFGQLASVTKLLAAGASDGGLAGSTEWTRPSPDNLSDRLNGAYLGFNSQPAVATTPLVVADQPPFLVRHFGTGMVVAAETDDLFKQPAQHWIWMLNTLGPDRWLWYRRHGLSLERKNGEFWNWLIHGVGLAPVTEFRVLITVFVLAIGPLNYFWLRRRGQLHLLVVFVPLAALAVTLSLFGYALVADGLDVRVRARTYTQIDQRTGQAACWSRVSYYAGLAPGGGLVFPDDMVVLPLAANDGQASDMAHRQNVIWSTHKQELVSGWLASRTPTEFITVRSRTTQAGLRFVPPRGQLAPQVENQLGTRIVRLLLADGDGKHFHAANIAAAARVELAAVDPADEEAAIYDIVADHQPGLPEGFVPPNSSYGFGGGRRYRFTAANNSLPAASLAGGRLETNLRDAVMGPGKHVSWSKPDGFPLAPRNYLAIVERSPEVVFGIDDPREEKSLHVVVGSW